MRLKYTALAFLVLVSVSLSYAQLSKQISLPVRASVQGNPPTITIAWTPFSDSIPVQIHRKDPLSNSWGAIYATIDSGRSSFIDTNVAQNKKYDYRVVRLTNPTAVGYIHSGINMQAAFSRGGVILLVDDTYKDSLRSEIDQLHLDLIGDGWKVYKRYVKRTDTIPDIKAIIVNLAALDNSISTVYLLGQVPVPYSGNIRPDGHIDHEGAWPADGYFGDLDGSWTDANIQNFAATRVENHNYVSDGKFDQSQFPSNIELNVGRVSLARLPSYGVDDIELTRRYLNKAHAWRSGAIKVPRRALIDDNFGSFEMGSSSWRGFYPLVDTGNIVENPTYDFRTELNKQAYLFAGGAGAGGYNSAAGVITTGQFTSDSIKAVFISIAGSYHGDWDASGNLLRAAIASSPMGLASFWGGIPNWILYPMGMDASIGHCARLTMNNSGTYAGNFNFAQRFVHIGLMGDPTLRAYPYPMVQNFKIDSTGRGDVKLTWSAPTGVNPLGYFLYRTSDLEAGFTLVSNLAANVNVYEDKGRPNGKYYYMVRPMGLETTPSGTFFTLGMGNIDSVQIRGVNVKKINRIEGLNLWPNPATDEFTIHAQSQLFDAQWELYDATGKLIKSGNLLASSTTIDCSALAKGLYIMKVSADEGTWESKVLKL